MIEKRIIQRYNNFKFKFPSVEARFKNTEYVIKKAIERYFERDSRIERVKGFNEEIKDFFESYRKDIYPSLFYKIY